ncbi:hypothetical protein PIB30_061469 [Stylosanthes scabra]|uniref:Uncharacterized protein n=1 Tax=Stylosanthes scabra TaxID=79078 RepID=A0ABU6VLV2_9FABA|nr:hypothetical protein [Stylosanthes scabra]
MDKTRANFRNQEVAIRNLEIQVEQIAKQLTENPPNTLPSDIIPNPREEYKAIRVIEMEETPEVQVEVPTEKPEIIAAIKNQEDVQHPPQSSKKHTRPFLGTSRALIDMESGELMLRIHDECWILNIYKSMHSSSGTKTCMKINSVDPASTKPPERSGKTIGNNSQHQESAEDSRPSPSQLKEEVTISPIPTEEEKKKKEPVAYMPKPPYPQRLKAENKSKAPKKEPKEEKGATNDSMKFQQIHKVPTMPYLPTIMGSNNKTYMITEGVCNKFFEPP